MTISFEINSSVAQSSDEVAVNDSQFLVIVASDVGFTIVAIVVAVVGCPSFAI